MRKLVLAALFAFLVAGALVAQGPLTPLFNLAGRTDSNGALMTSAGAYSGTQGPLTPMGQLRGRTDSSGQLLVTVGGGTLTPTSVSIAQGTRTTDAQALTSTVTWNNGAVAFTHWKAVITDTASAATSMALQIFGGAAGTTNLFSVSKAGLVTAPAVVSSAAQITAGSATGLTITSPGTIRTQVYKVNVGPTAFVCAAVTCDLTIGTLPAANVWTTNVTAQLVTTFACAATCTTSTLSFIVGKGAGGAEYLASFDADAAAGFFGDADAELGTLMTRAAAIQGGTFSSGTQALVLRLTSGTGNIGNGTVTNLSQGSIFIWVTTTVID